MVYGVRTIFFGEFNKEFSSKFSVGPQGAPEKKKSRKMHKAICYENNSWNTLNDQTPSKTVDKWYVCVTKTNRKTVHHSVIYFVIAIELFWHLTVCKQKLYLY